MINKFSLLRRDRRPGLLSLVWVAAGIAIGLSQPLPGAEAPDKASKPRIGLYNSRAVALAYGRSDMFRTAASKLHAEGKQAKAAGDEKRLAELTKRGTGMQDRIHRQVFGDAPIDDILDSIKDSLPDIQKKAGVQKLASKDPRDPSVEVVDITALLVEHFKPTAETLKMIEEIKKQPPLSADKFPLKD